MKIEGYNQRKILAKNLANLLLIIFIPLIALSALSVVVTQRYIKEEVNKNNLILLEQASQKFDLIINELDTFSLNYGVNPFMIIELDHIFNQQTLTYEDMQILTIIESYIDSSSYVKPYVHSIYLYYDNPENRMISSLDTGITFLKNYYDRKWYQTFSANRGKTGVYSELRSLNNSPSGPQQSILTLYKNLFTGNGQVANGVIVMNIRTDFMQELLKSAISYPDEGFAIANENYDPLISYHLPFSITQQDLKQFLADNRQTFIYRTSATTFTITKYHSPNYGWTYLSITPNRSLYLVPNRLKQITVAFSLLALLLGLLLASYFTRKNYNSFLSIVRIMEAAKSGLSLPAESTKVKDEHGYIIQNLVQAFVNQDYLKMQLSERKFHTKVLELLALQSQINPHFLYNTLHTISWKAISITKKPNEVSAMIDNLSTILKYVLSNSNEMVSLDEEVYYTVCYVNIQSIRYRNKFRVDWAFEDNLAEIKVMKLMLQPLIENSIYHGIKEKEGEGTISIRISRDGKFLKFWLVDNGLGMTKNRLKEISKKFGDEEMIHTDHIGLYNVNKRLLLTYGDTYRMRIRSVYGQGTAIYIKIPIF